jgi:hypothetical protein
MEDGMYICSLTRSALRLLLPSDHSICPGSHFAEANLFLLISSLMYVFEIRRAVDENGEEIVPEVKMALDSTLVW